ncbi:hypothetical protein CBR_g29449 [Chara braunii]|uniref:Protein kinase domain-containing protein n=1 Tax=Chara braunii TaxID=69332 RepID=A0A388LAF6_CHABU|nr:hypothetical protein CBR_g29449 [Chara braunii]|eukprot:GBG79299.1 hypothetical protein CBR_g29449 [Chara braunii]
MNDDDASMTANARQAQGARGDGGMALTAGLGIHGDEEARRAREEMGEGGFGGSCETGLACTSSRRGGKEMGELGQGGGREWPWMTSWVCLESFSSRGRELIEEGGGGGGGGGGVVGGGRISGSRRWNRGSRKKTAMDGGRAMSSLSTLAMAVVTLVALLTLSSMDFITLAAGDDEIRINCGGKMINDELLTWREDCFFIGGTPVRVQFPLRISSTDKVLDDYRRFPLFSEQEMAVGTYRISGLTEGYYAVVLIFNEDRVPPVFFDVSLQNHRVDRISLSSTSPLASFLRREKSQREYRVYVANGTLEIGFIALPGGGYPRVAGIVVVPFPAASRMTHFFSWARTGTVSILRLEHRLACGATGPPYVVEALPDLLPWQSDDELLEPIFQSAGHNFRSGQSVRDPLFPWVHERVWAQGRSPISNSSLTYNFTTAGADQYLVIVYFNQSESSVNISEAVANTSNLLPVRCADAEGLNVMVVGELNCTVSGGLRGLVIGVSGSQANRTITLSFSLKGSDQEKGSLIVSGIEVYGVLPRRELPANEEGTFHALADYYEFDNNNKRLNPCLAPQHEAVECETLGQTSNASVVQFMLPRRLLPRRMLRERNATQPKEINERLNGFSYMRQLHVEGNNLTGPVPEELRRLKSFTHDSGLSANVPLAVPNRDPSNDDSEQNQSQKKTKFLKILIPVMVLGIALLLAILALLTLYLCRKRRGDTMIFSPNRNREVQLLNPKDAARGDINLSDLEINKSNGMRVFTYPVLHNITNNFQTKIGSGGFGNVYKGQFASKETVAIKLLKSNAKQGVEEFRKEVEALSPLRHRFLVRLIGYCNDQNHQALIYEYVPNGSLKDALHGPQSKLHPLTWRARLQIVLDAGQGVLYLHKQITPAIIHRDIKASNILVDHKYHGKLADFGLSKLLEPDDGTHVFTAIKGTKGYVDPEYAETQVLTEKSDVYSFGVLLLEIITGKRPADMVHRKERGRPSAPNLIEWVKSTLQEETEMQTLLPRENWRGIEAILDPKLPKLFNVESIKFVLTVALHCTNKRAKERPKMQEVVRELQDAIAMEDLPSLSDMAPRSKPTPSRVSSSVRA